MKLAESAWLYDFGQTIAGAARSRARLGAIFQQMALTGRILDLGGGTGAIIPYLPGNTAYTSLDNERPKLQRLRSRFPAAPAILSDATLLPILSESVDAVLAIALPHHLADTALERMLRETVRVLKPGGRLILLEPLKSRRWTARVLWRLDRGSHARTGEDLIAVVQKHLAIIYQERYSILHDYLILVSAKIAA